MAPALTKTAKSGIHLSSSLLTDSMGSDSPVLGIDLEPQMKFLEDSYSERMWLNLSSLPFLDTCGSKNPLEYPDVLLQPILQGSGYYKTVLLSNPRALVGQLSINKTKKSLMAQGDILLPPLPDLSHIRDAPAGLSLRQLSSSVAESLDVSNSPSLTPGNPGEHLLQKSAAGCAVLTDRIGEGDGMGIDRSWTQHWGSRVSRIPRSASVKDAVRDQTLQHLSEQGTLVARAERIQRRLQALLVEHASHHCTQQLEGLKAKLLQKDLSPISPTQPTTPSAAENPTPYTDSKPTGAQAELESLAAVTLNNLTSGAPTRTGSVSTESSVDMQNFARCASAALRGIQSALDSDATESSSDDEWEPKTSGTSTQSMSEWRWQAERAELSSRWTWLQLRVAELEGRIQQLGDLRQRIRLSKGGVVLADSQPLTDRQIQQTLLTEMAGLSFTAGGAGELTSDLEMEPSSPTRLLRNIERQSAQLTQIVNSLMPPLSLSPSSSPVSKPHTNGWMGTGQQKRSFNSNGVMFQAGRKRRRVCRRKQRPAQPYLTCVSARTRPLLTYHKPHLFISSPPCSSGEQEEQFLSSTCSSCRSCDPLALCTDSRCPGNPASTAQRTHPVLSLRSDTPLSFHLQNGLQKEDWTLRPLPLKTEPSSPLRFLRCGRKEPRRPAAFNFGYTPLPHRRRPKSRCEPGVRGPPRRSHQKGRRKRLYHDSSLDEAELLSSFAEPPSPEESAEEALTPHPHNTRHRSSQFVRRRNGESVYDINNIAIPMSLAAPIKLEKLLYKDILTPSWRVVEPEPVVKEEEEEQERVEEEDDEVGNMASVLVPV
ncbi:KAT8 regulatory NSL complex subunit 1-like protein [Clupea harengus]|uniref:KAT8 regulatory NSL complex subunit 1-like protein n=1 Tax=Clupea harengus TaxID=7950 RepID=A0A8M1KN62_CLUHA|nr:KAT8 regulatory NSL complex subunit 1-like protein [Clupea harengus]